MVLGIFLSSGESFKTMSKSGQDIRFKHFYLRKFAKHFTMVYVFSYDDEKVRDLPSNVRLISNRFKLHRFIYGILLPFLNYRDILECNVFRAYHVLGTPPAIITRIFFSKPFVFNYGYDYIKFAKIERKYLQVILIKIINTFAIQFASKIIATTKEMYKVLPRQKTIFIPNGIDIRMFKPKKNKLLYKNMNVLSVGRLEPQKNYASLISAMKGLRAQLIIIGSGALKSKLLTIAKNLKVDLKIIDVVENLKLPKLYNNADIFVMSSIIEGPTKVLLEAMACGLPVIATNVPGINEVVRNKYNGILTKTDSYALRQALVSLMKDAELRKNIGDKARLTVKIKYNLDTLLLEEISELKNTNIKLNGRY